MECPVLVLYGELDRGVPVDPNKKVLENALQNNPNVTFHIFPKGNHALMLGETGSMKEFPNLTRFVPDLFPTMIRWIKAL
jgi:pimeloyl-ACP methyl ester carboxylesterase